MRTWAEIVALMAAAPPRARFYVLRVDVSGTPLQNGFRAASGLPVGQSDDYRLTLADNRSVHVQEYPNRWELHVDAVDPSVDAFGHAAADLPVLTFVALPVVGAMISHFVFRRRGAWKTGALAGAGIALDAIARRQRS